jgi:hypothetical protein
MYRFILLLVIALSTQFTIQAQIPSYVPTNGLVGWWPFNGNANDESGNGNNGVLTGVQSTSNRLGIQNSALLFNGSSSITIPHNSKLNSDFISFSLWFNTNSKNFGSLIYKTSSSAKNEQFGCVLNYPVENSTVWSVKNGNNCANPGAGWQTTTMNKPISTGNWHHLVCTYDGQFSKVFLDGKLIVEDTFQPSKIDNCIGDINIGKGYDDNYYFNGKIDDLAIWNRPLNVHEIYRLYKLLEPVSLSIVDKKSVSCFNGNDGSATVEASGGEPPYTFTWNTSPILSNKKIDGLTAGKYKVTVSDNSGQVSETEVEILQPNAPLSTVSAKVEKQISCFGENDGSVSIPIPTGGTPPYSVIWNGNSDLNTYVLIGLKPGVYSAIIKDANGCTVSSQATIIEPAQVVVSSPKDTTVLIQTKAELVASTNQTASKYQWQSNTGTGYQYLENVFQYSGVKTSKLTIDNITLANHNQPFRCIIETNGCFDTTAIAVLSVRTNVGVDEEFDSETCRVYPNPTGDSEELLVQLENVHSQVLNIELLDMMGISRVQTGIQSQNGIFPIAVSGIAKGMYIVRVITSSGILTQKIIVN